MVQGCLLVILIETPLPITWLTCLCCKHRLAPVVIRDGVPVIPVISFSVVVYIEQAEITCPQCLTVRRFEYKPPVKRRAAKLETATV